MNQVTIKLENGKWTVNGKTFQQMSNAEKKTLSRYIEMIKNEIEDYKIQKSIIVKHHSKEEYPCFI